MPPLVALATETPTVDGVKAYTEGAASGLQLEGLKREQAMQGIRNIGSVALGAMGGDIEGQVDPDAYEKGLTLLEQYGVVPSDKIEAMRGKPELARIAAKASLTAMEQISIARDEREYQQALKEFDQKLNGGTETFGVSPIEGTIDGKPAFLQVGNKGSIKQVDLPEGWETSSQFEKVDTGTGTLVINKKTNEQQFIPKDLRGAEREKGIGKAEGQREGEEPERQQKADAALGSLGRKNEIMNTDIDRAVSMIEQNPSLSAGFLGSRLASIEGTPAYNIAKLIDTIAGNVGFSELQSMRDASPTGGALGQVSERENQLLQALQGSLDQGQTPEQLVTNLKRIKRLAKEVMEERRAAYEKDFGSNTAPGTAAAPSDTGAEDDFIILGVE